MYLHIFFGLPAFLLLRWNSGEVYAPALEMKKKKKIMIELVKQL